MEPSHAAIEVFIINKKALTPKHAGKAYIKNNEKSGSIEREVWILKLCNS